LKRPGEILPGAKRKHAGTWYCVLQYDVVLQMHPAYPQISLIGGMLSQVCLAAQAPLIKKKQPLKIKS
jgi:hypothetical protein